jgi:hypothetical protein
MAPAVPHSRAERFGPVWLSSGDKRLMKLPVLFTAMLLMWGVGCVHQSQSQIAVTNLDKSADGCLTRSAAIRAADRAAEAAGFKLSDYKEREASLWENIHAWYVSYEPKVLVWQVNGLGISWPTNRFRITVNMFTAVASKPMVPIPN